MNEVRPEGPLDIVHLHTIRGLLLYEPSSSAMVKWLVVLSMTWGAWVQFHAEARFHLPMKNTYMQQVGPHY